MRACSWTQPPLGAVACFNLKLAPDLSPKENQHRAIAASRTRLGLLRWKGRVWVEQRVTEPSSRISASSAGQYIQAQVLDKLSVVVGDVPDSNDRDA